MQAAEFAATLKALQTGHRLQCGEDPYAAVQALDETLASLQKLQADLKRTKEYRAAEEAQKQSDASDRVRRLTEELEKAQAAAEAMLGYPLTSAHYRSSGNFDDSLYHLLPEGYVHHQKFDCAVQRLKQQLANQEARLDKIRGELGASELTPAPPFLRGDLKQALEAKQAELHSATVQVRCARSQLLGFMATHKPMRDARFGETLAGHLDAMLDAYVALHAP
jgi:hypothetical protein